MTSWQSLPNSADALLSALQSQTVTAAIHLSGVNFINYESGILDDCGTYQDYVNHAVLVVGAGVEYIGGQKKPYWLVQNSWGTSWGLSGLAKILATDDARGLCGLYTLM